MAHPFESKVYLAVYRSKTRPYLCLFVRLAASFLLWSDCAVCAGNFSSGFLYSCHSCSERSKTLTLGLGTTVATFTLFIVGVVVHELVRKVDCVTEGRPGGTGRWSGSRPSCLASLSKAFPRTAVKIVVVVWQISTQVRCLHFQRAARFDNVPDMYLN